MKNSRLFSAWKPNFEKIALIYSGCQRALLISYNKLDI